VLGRDGTRRPILPPRARRSTRLSPPHGISIRNVLRGRIAKIAPADRPITEVRLDLAGTPRRGRRRTV
jgi:ABC-type molybdate transport system ATPase subunit